VNHDSGQKRLRLALLSPHFFPLIKTRNNFIKTICLLILGVVYRKKCRLILVKGFYICMLLAAIILSWEPFMTPTLMKSCQQVL
jgi:hypothetical protein